MSRLGFAIRCLGKIAARQNYDCPYCGGTRTRMLGLRMIVLQLRRCDDCALMYRWPKDSVTENTSFYQTVVQKNATFTPPSEEEFTALNARGFQVGYLDYSSRLAVLQSLGLRGRLLDYGASWGYGVAQFRAAGFDAAGFEISRPRAEYGRTKLGLRLEHDCARLPDHSFDIIHSAHVLEHIPDPKIAMRDFRRLLKPSGTLVIFVPNGGGKDAREHGMKWGFLINEKHVVAMTAEFLDRAFSDYGFAASFSSEPLVAKPEPLRRAPALEGEELLAVARIAGP